MKRVLFFLSILGILYSQPYKPKPILFIHGRSGSSITWGVVPDSVKKIEYRSLIPPIQIPYFNPSTDTILLDSIIP